MEKTEVTQFMKEITFKEKRATKRMGDRHICGGGLKAYYTLGDTGANICTTAGKLGLKYGKDFIWEYHGYDKDDDDCVTLMVKEDKYETFLHLALQNDHKIKHTQKGDAILVKSSK